MKPPRKPARKQNSSSQRTGVLLARDGMSGERTFIVELERLRGELREHEADANALAERIGALQQRIDTAVSKLENGQDVTRRKVTHKRVPKK